MLTKTLEQQIEVMTAFKNGARVGYRISCNSEGVEITNREFTGWDWKRETYEILEPKKIITIERWLIKNKERFGVEETSSIKDYIESCVGWEKVKLLDSYEVEL